MTTNVPIITLDGPAGVGKSTLATGIANKLGYAMLASGSIYRLLGWQALQEQQLEHEEALVRYAHALQNSDWLSRITELGTTLTTSEVSAAASTIATYPQLRTALLDLQRDCAKQPNVKGLVAEGRDMGTIVFPHAPCKLFITASPQVRAKRRCLQQAKEVSEIQLATIAAEIAARDARDAGRNIAPLKPAADALLVDTSELDIHTTFEKLFIHIAACIDV